MHTIAHGGCTNTIKGLSLKADFGEKILAAPWSRGLYKYHKRACIESWLWNKKSLLHQGVGGCTNTTKGLALKADFGRKNPYSTRELNPCKKCTGPDMKPNELHSHLSLLYQTDLNTFVHQLIFHSISPLYWDYFTLITTEMATISQLSPAVLWNTNVPNWNCELL